MIARSAGGVLAHSRRPQSRGRARWLTVGATMTALLTPSAPALGQNPAGAIYTQCPGDINGDAVPDGGNPNVRCMHLTGGDGFVTMADGRRLYMFGFSDITGQLSSQAMDLGALSANFPAPTIRLEEGNEFYLNLTNVGMVMRPDLSDPHSVHFHGFPQAAPVFDGTPENSIIVNMGSTLSYYYNIVEPGTYMYHCHVEATEHMQMGMLGNLYVEPRQNQCGPLFRGLPNPCPPGHAPGNKYVYNDGDRSTRYDVEYPIQIGSFDPDFHDASETVQPLPFAAMKDRYGMLNGRGYPDTIDTGVISTETDRGTKPSQPVHSLITAAPGQRVLLRISNLNVTRFYTLASTIPMKVVGHNARLHRGPTGTNLYYTTNSVTLGGGEAIDVILETAGITPGTYLLYTTNLNYLSNDAEDFGGMMTEIRIQ
jgi:FtsP/CotA-like multicopper oxidase with cupredoxin domain